MDLEQLNKVVRAIGSFILTCIAFACPICLALLIYTKHARIILGFVLFIISIVEFFSVLFYIYFHSEGD